MKKLTVMSLQFSSILLLDFAVKIQWNPGYLGGFIVGAWAVMFLRITDKILLE